MGAHSVPNTTRHVRREGYLSEERERERERGREREGEREGGREREVIIFKDSG